MRWRTLLGLGVATAIAVACSSSQSNQLGGPTTPTIGSDGGIICPPDTTAASAADGKGYVTTRNCPSCHGADMSGTTVPVVVPNEPANVTLYAPNLTPDQATGIGDWSDEQLKGAIVDGVDNMSQSLCPQMKHYKTMCNNEVAGIIAYLRSLPAVSKKIPGSICPPLKTK